MMETCARRVLFTAALLVLSTVIAETFSTDSDTDNPLSTETFYSRASGLKQTSSWPGREATATAVDLSSGLGEMTEIPASVSITAAREGHSPKPLQTSTNAADWKTSTTSDETTEHLQSDTELTHNATAQWESPSSASHSITSHHPVTETRTVRDVTDLIDMDTTDSVSHTDSTYISTTNRVGERTLLSVISNSTFAYTQNSSISDAESQTSPWEEKTSGATQVNEETEETVSTVSEQTDPTFEGRNTTSATLETERSTLSQGTESQTGQPSVTGQTAKEVTDIDNPNSTPPLTVTSRDVEETDATSVSSETSYTQTSSDSASSILPFTSSEHNVTSTSQESHNSTLIYSTNTGGSTEFSTGSVSSTAHEETERSSTRIVDETTLHDVTSAPPVLEDVATTIDDSLSKFPSGQSPTIPKTDDQTNTQVVPTSTHRPQVTDEATDEVSTVYSSTTTLTTTTPSVTTRQLQPHYTTVQTQTQHTTIVTTDIIQVLRTTPSTAHHVPTLTTSGPQAPSTADSSDVTTLHLETSTATPGNTTAHGGRATTPFSKSSPGRTTVVVTTGHLTDKSTTETGSATTQMPLRTSASPGHVCGPKTCANGGHCVRSAEGSYYCQCLSAWTGPFCTEDVDECVNSPCPQGSVCVNTGGSFSCECDLGFDLEDGRSCTQVKTFLGTFTVNNSLHLRNLGLHELHREIQQLLNASLSIFHGYRRFTLGKRDGQGVQIPVVSMFSLSSNVTSADVFNSIQMSLNNCSRTYSHCPIKLQHQLSYHVESLCMAQKTKCDVQYSDCSDISGIPNCQCLPGYFKRNPEDMTCRDCGDGLKLVNGKCVECMFGFGGFNCNNFYKLIAVVVSPAGGALLLIVVIALIVTCCKKDKNDINKIIFKSGELQMSPYAEFPKSNRVSMEWGRETIEMQENGSTKNLLQMTDIYYSPALRNSDLERNGLYPFSGLPGSRHSCIYPAQWNPSFLSDDSRRRDYF
uniref:Protein HEG n=2 Tax=Danio rerio TaxID=7955 RepID=HEG_DANRE|nr:RecName: Full=Protein HEG; AltName: Full=Heart of glass; Flags: Precursor [Danio rerio]AAR87664.1 heart of glass transmembrane isoform [Danio rerio]